MDLNQLLYHHQLALMAVSQAQRDGQILPNFDLPRYYAKRIDEYRAQRGLDESFADLTEYAPGGPRADPPTSEPGDAYPVFIGDTLIAELLINKALSMPDEERTAYALEGIIDRLAEVQEALWAIGHDIYHALDYDEDKLVALAEGAQISPMSPGGGTVHLKPFRSRSEDGIEHSYVEQFSVGPFRYSSIDDARAALVRQRIAAGLSGEQANDV